LPNALPLNIKICRNDTKVSKPAFKSTLALISSNMKGNLLQFLRNVHDFWLPPPCTWDLRSSTLRCVISQ